MYITPLSSVLFRGVEGEVIYKAFFYALRSSFTLESQLINLLVHVLIGLDILLLYITWNSGVFDDNSSLSLTDSKN